MSKILPQFRRLEQTRLRLGKYRTAILQAISLTRRTNKIQRPCFSVSYLLYGTNCSDAIQILQFFRFFH
ncbi:hypothetical protein ANACOL_03505 [Anaerotruncus colihominis DSM 17241]|uniref:Uncharacterized protein n=1 Tax=Anaerotruncus colihominis DSM 17241 TaxID=445972 RepID=B0PFC6_9FIRM|nr:hypothetical protein ANACOL_03505 [Anaerotruncus colihominis DSM 17241]